MGSEMCIRDSFEVDGPSRVASTRVLDICEVSTVFLSLDHGFDGRPLLFETMAFWRGGHGYEQTRCSTWLEAQRQHDSMCAEVARPASIAAYIGRVFQDWWDRAKRDFGRRWRELRGVELTEMDMILLRMEETSQERW